MNKETFLAMSLPHELRVYVKYSHSPDNSELETLYGIVDGRIITNQFEEDIAPLPISNYGVVLHPLSDYENFDDILGLIYCNEIFRVIKGWQKIEDLSFLLVNKMIELHIDVFNLIEKGEAIDVNTLELNPYK